MCFVVITRYAVGVTTASRRKTSRRLRVFRLAALVVVEKAGRWAACPEPFDFAQGRLCRRGVVRLCKRCRWDIMDSEVLIWRH